MDDTLQQPTYEPKIPKIGEETIDDEDQSSGDEDEGPDWTKLNQARPVIPKRGDKEFEPKQQGAQAGSNLQQAILQRSRNAMFEALKAQRTISNKTVSYGTWHPSLSRVSIQVARGTAMNNIGHSAPRNVQEKGKIQKRLELLPEEAVYLIERGSLMCWKEDDGKRDVETESDVFESITGTPMSVQQAYTEMIGTEDLSMERYQVYAYLKRLGYTITRSKPPNEFYPVAAPYPKSLSSSASSANTSIMHRIRQTFSSCFSRLFSWLFSKPFDWWKPLRISRWLKSEKNYPFIFRSLRFIPSGHTVPIHTTPDLRENLASSPYEPFFNLYKPPTPFKKSAPPPPDYQIVVVNARTTPMPTLHELSAIYANAPELPPPKPRVRNPPQVQGVSYKKTKDVEAGKATDGNSSITLPSQSLEPTITATTTIASSPSKEQSHSSTPSSLSWPFRFFSRSSKPEIKPQERERKPNPFAILRNGKKTAIIAAVDAGTINIFRFAQGAFECGPWF